MTAYAAMVHLTAIDHRAPPVVIVHAPCLDMEAQQVVEGFGDAHRLLAGLPVGIDEELAVKRLGEFFYIGQRDAPAHLPFENALQQIVLKLLWDRWPEALSKAMLPSESWYERVRRGGDAGQRPRSERIKRWQAYAGPADLRQRSSGASRRTSGRLVRARSSLCGPHPIA